MNFKEKIYNTFLQNLRDKIYAYQVILTELRESVLNETKSTAGDKHETALAMLQMEQSQIAKHMQDAVEARNVFLQLDISAGHERIKNGSLIKTNHGYFLLGVALPKIEVDGKTALAISPKSPLGSLMIGRKAGEKIHLNQISHLIEEIV